jgi:hypothetical protein
LKDVIRIEVFNDKYHGFSRGVLLDYKNGARRAVGACRLGVDKVVTYLNPSRICYYPSQVSQTRPLPGHAVRVKSGGDPTHDHREDGWVCSPMEGSLQFWFSELEEAFITIVPGADH